MKKLHLGTMSYGFDSMDEVKHQLATAYGDPGPFRPSQPCRVYSNLTLPHYVFT
jgi:hypothetical protein